MNLGSIAYKINIYKYLDRVKKKDEGWESNAFSHPNSQLSQANG